MWNCFQCYTRRVLLVPKEVHHQSFQVFWQKTSSKVNFRQNLPPKNDILGVLKTIGNREKIPKINVSRQIFVV